MQELIFNLGVERANNPEIRKSRIIFNLGENKSANIIEFAMQKMMEIYNINLFDYRTEIIERENSIGFYLNWHIDDCAVYKHNNTENKTNNVPLDDKYSLFHLKELPKYTMIIYLSSIDIDFKGGELEFVDLLIRPRKYDVVFFDSREVHKVRTFRKGVRKNILIKFFA
jgi:hypothetical protein